MVEESQFNNNEDNNNLFCFVHQKKKNFFAFNSKQNLACE